MPKIILTKEVIKNISKQNYYTQQDFIEDCKTYLKALKSGRLKYEVKSVSKSGMSRQITVQSYEGTMSKGSYRQYLKMFEILKYKTKYDTISVSGCGMDMLFATNYTICKILKDMGFINEKQCAILEQTI